MCFLTSHGRCLWLWIQHWSTTIYYAKNKNMTSNHPTSVAVDVCSLFFEYLLVGVVVYLVFSCFVLSCLVSYFCTLREGKRWWKPVAKDNLGNPYFGTAGGCWGNVKMLTERCDTKTRLHARFLIRSNTWHGKPQKAQWKTRSKNKVKRKTTRQAPCSEKILISCIILRAITFTSCRAQLLGGK